MFLIHATTTTQQQQHQNQASSVIQQNISYEKCELANLLLFNIAQSLLINYIIIIEQQQEKQQQIKETYI